MPYIAVKAYPRDEATKEALAEKLSEALVSVLGCPAEAVTVSVEDVAPENWEKQVVKVDIEPNRDKMMILSGKKCGK